MHPRDFATELAQKVFTNGADVEVVARLYADSCLGTLGRAKELSFQHLKWGDADAAKLADLMPLLRDLQTLDISFNRIGRKGFGVLGAAISRGAASNLKRIIVGQQAVPEEESAVSVMALDPVWSKGQALQEACRARGIHCQFVGDNANARP